MLLYHGSAAGGLTRLTGQPCVYLTPYPCYALCYIRDPNVNYVTCGVDKDGVVRYDENFPEQLRTLYAGRSGWLYRCGEGDGRADSNVADAGGRAGRAVHSRRLRRASPL